MGAGDARHLLNRAGFGTSPQEIADFSRLSHEQAVTRLLESTVTEASTPLPSGVDEYIRPGRLKLLADDEKKAVRRKQFEIGANLRAWWIAEMLATPSPLTERMTLFWHNHFVSSQQKVKSARLMARQNALLRRYALGNFGTLLHAVAKDPAMIIYLDSATNRKGQPNENFAREVMELFTLGEGHYSEKDIKEAARAYTGWSIEPETGDYKWRPFFHDDGVKTVLGKTGKFDGDDVLDILLAQPATAAFIVTKLWREFISAEPEPKEVARIAKRFRDSRYDIKSTLRELLLSSAFWAEGNRAALVKSPVDLVVGTLHEFGFQTGDPLPFAFTVRQLGQDLFAPPNVKGWPGGEDWINTTTLLARKQFLERLFRGQEFMETMRPADGMQARYEDAAPAWKKRVAALKEEFGKGGARMGDEGRQRLMHALQDIRFDADAWLKATDKLGLDPAAVMLPQAPSASREKTGDELGSKMADKTVSGLALIRTLALDPLYQLK